METVTDATQTQLDLQRFIVDGYITLPPASSTPAAVHKAVFDALLVHETDRPIAGNDRIPYGLSRLQGSAAGNNLLHAVPELRGPALLESPTLKSALCAILGPEYRIHPHCRAHLRRRPTPDTNPGPDSNPHSNSDLRRRGAPTSMWHVDAYKGTSWCALHVNMTRSTRT